MKIEPEFNKTHAIKKKVLKIFRRIASGADI